MMPFNGYGSYLVRESETSPGNYTLSVRDNEQVRHYRIVRLDNGRFSVSLHVTFETVENLIAYYHEQADGLCTNLIHPCVLNQKHTQTAGLSVARQANEEWEIDKQQIGLLRKVTSDTFFEVWVGRWNRITPVAVQIFIRPQQNMDILQKAELMQKIRHQNIIKFYGVCTKEEPVYMVTELMKHSLLEYLSSERMSVRLSQLIDMASQVAAGMAYLEKQNIIHRDLAARNVQVGEDLICKVSNFERAREMIGEYFYEAPNTEKRQIKWAALEVVLYRRYTIKSDVWSFGIVLYEIVTYGQFPYPGMHDAQVKEQLQQGYRMPRPFGCLDKLYNIMLDCFDMLARGIC
jgi:fyn-related kinase